MRDKLLAISQRLMPPARRALATDLGLLVGRVLFGGLMLTHGYTKLANFAAYSEKFPDVIGIGSTASLGLAVFAEFGCSILLILGLFTRFAALNLAITMFVAAFVVHWSDPFAKKELALLYLSGYLVFLLTGPGRMAVDRWILGRGETQGTS